MNYAEFCQHLLECALFYRGTFGFSIIPVRLNKAPAIRWSEFNERVATEAELTSWWRGEFDGSAIGFVCGQVSGGLVVLDCDPRNGLEGLDYVLEHVPLDGPCVETPSGGRHYYFRSEVPVATVLGFRPGLDVKGENSYVVAPPSIVRKDGKIGIYRWAPGFSIEERDIPPFPKGLQAAQRTYSNSLEFEERPKDWAEEIIRNGVGEGERNITMTRLVGHFLGKNKALKEFWPVLLEANRRFRPPLPLRELDAIVKSMSKKHERELQFAN